VPTAIKSRSATIGDAGTGSERSAASARIRSIRSHLSILGEHARLGSLAADLLEKQLMLFCSVEKPESRSDMAIAAAREADPGPTLTKALLRAAALLDLQQGTMADLLGVSRATASRLFGGSYQLLPARKKEWELAVLFVRLFRSLDAIVGHGDLARAWLRGSNAALGAAPIALIGSAEGLVRVVHYLDTVRGRV
jgi:Antitoxin Xre/MbcA/ParS C-terminal toxin-binding domain/Antitoxin Xre-like helix-turn-helix domain